MKKSLIIFVLLLIGLTMFIGCSSSTEKVSFEDNNVYVEDDEGNLSNDDYSEWLIYKNSEYGFELKYKPGWEYSLEIATYYDSNTDKMIETNQKVLTFYKNEDNVTEEFKELGSTYEFGLFGLYIDDKEIGVAEDESEKLNNSKVYLEFFKFMNNEMTSEEYQYVKDSLKFN